MGEDLPPPNIQAVEASGLRCVGCGYDISGQVIGGKCPECGMAIRDSIMAPHVHLPTSIKAVLSMTFGICGLVGCIVYLFPTLLLSPTAIVLGHSARRDVQRGIVSQQSGGMALSGIILGWIGVALLAFVGLSFLAFSL